MIRLTAASESARRIKDGHDDEHFLRHGEKDEPPLGDACEDEDQDSTSADNKLGRVLNVFKRYFETPPKEPTSGEPVDVARGNQSPPRTDPPNVIKRAYFASPRPTSGEPAFGGDAGDPTPPRPLGDEVPQKQKLFSY